MVLVIIALGAYMIINLSKGKQIEEQENNIEDGDVINNSNTNLIDFHPRVRATLHGGMVLMGTILIGMTMMQALGQESQKEVTARKEWLMIK